MPRDYHNLLSAVIALIVQIEISRALLYLPPLIPLTIHPRPSPQHQYMTIFA